MDKIRKFIVPGFIILLLLLIFRGWLKTGVLSTGDWPYLYPKAVSELVPFSSWDVLFNNGMGQSALPSIWLSSYALTIVKLSNILSWPIFERVIWFFPYLLTSFFSAFLLSKKFGLGRDFNLLSGVIYSLNTYILLIASGGQVGVMMAYAVLPIVFLVLYSLIEKFSLKKSIILSLALSLLILLDLRVGYVFLVGEFLLCVLYLIFYHDKIIKKLAYIFVIPGIIAFLLHVFWIMPLIFIGKNSVSQLSGIYTSTESLDFFSFAKLENTIGLLHPNWPENIFGKVSFMRPEFLIIPILAFASLLFVGRESKSRKISILSLSLLGLVGIFLAKGTNDPFGELYGLAFSYFPGFVMLRDPTKWYMLIAISFSILIPYSLFKVSEHLETLKKIKWAKLAVCLIFLFFWALLIKDSFIGVVKGTLSPRMIPPNFQNFAKLIESKNSFSRTLWIPTYPTFAYVSNTHPAVPGIDFFVATSTADLISKMNQPGSEKIIQDASIKYVILPEDVDGKIFVTNRKYDEKVYNKALDELNKVDYLRRVDGYGKIAVFEVENPRGHIWSPSTILAVGYRYVSPTKYIVNVRNAKQGDFLVFSEGFDKNWEARSSSIKYKVSSIRYKNILNSFVLPADGSYSFEIYYKPQDWVNIGLIISGLTLGLIVLFFVRHYKKG